MLLYAFDAFLCHMFSVFQWNRSWYLSCGGKGKAKESESSEVEREPVKPKETPVEPVASVAMALDVPLIVSGCQNPTISEIVKGTYFRHGSNHGKPVYKKKQEEVTDDDDLDVLIYFWDDRDGEENCGWWFSPSVGGEMVWAYHPSRKASEVRQSDLRIGQSWYIATNSYKIVINRDITIESNQ